MSRATDPPHTRALVRGGITDPLLPHLIAHLDDAATVAIAASFLLESGVRLLEEHLRDVLDQGGRVRIVTGDYLGITEPRALLCLLDLQGDFHLRVFQTGGMPTVDTILMLRPTESRILWLQQFGRGLRHRPGKTLKVIDYIGNHRVFLTKTRALFSLGNADRDVAYKLDQLDAGTAERPPGCSVTYELEAMRILRALIRPPDRETALRSWYEEFRSRNGVRPSALEVFHEDYDPKAARPGYGSWLGFVRSMGDFTAEQEQVWGTLRPFLEQLEKTEMTRSYKMVLLLALLGEDAFPSGVSLDRLVERFAELARRYTVVRNELGGALDDTVSLKRLIEKDPVAAWTGGRGTGGVAYFTYDGTTFGTSAAIVVPPALREAAQDLVWEIAEWRLGVHVRRVGLRPGAGRIVCKVIQSRGRPILFLPDRTKTEGIPEGWRAVVADGESLQAYFVKIAVNKMQRAGSSKNVLPEVLRRWFGPQAGSPGRTEHVVFERRGDEYVVHPTSHVDDTNL